MLISAQLVETSSDNWFCIAILKTAIASERNPGIGVGRAKAKGKRPGDEVGYTHPSLGHNIQDKAEFKISFPSLLDWTLQKGFQRCLTSQSGGYFTLEWRTVKFKAV